MPPRSTAPAKSVKGDDAKSTAPAKSVKGDDAKSTKTGAAAAKKRETFPVSQVDYTQPLIVKNSKVSFGEKMNQVCSSFFIN